MHYPWWHVPFLTAPMLIAIVAVIHMFVSHYAVGGGLFLAIETQHAYKKKDKPYLAYLKSHTWFFVLITVVFGAITGVGIWWIIGLASPLATEVLIHTFVFGWAIEYVFFVIEIAAAFIFFYYWGRLPQKTHMQIGWIYALAAWISLVLITGITGFMLHPGSWTLENPNFWAGFLNPQFLPQVLARTGGALLLTSMYVYTHAAFKATDPQLRDQIEKRSSRPALLGALLVIISGPWWYLVLPASAKVALAAAAPLNLLMAAIFMITIGVFVMLYLGPYKNPGWLSPGFALVMLAMGMGAIGAGEFIREAVRKPYISYNVVLSNQVLVNEVAPMREAGYLESGTWTSAWLKDNYPELISGEIVDEAKLVDGTLSLEAREEVGQVLFQYHCNDCHAAEQGMSAVAHIMHGWPDELIDQVVREPEQFHFFMPPWCGTEEEAVCLTDYLKSITEDSGPGGMLPEDAFARGAER